MSRQENQVYEVTEEVTEISTNYQPPVAVASNTYIPIEQQQYYLTAPYPVGFHILSIIQ